MLPSFWPKREDLKNAHRVRQGRLFNTSLAWHRRPFKVGPPPALPVLFPESCTLHLRFHLGEQTHTSAATPHSRPMADAVINQTCHSFSLGTDSASESFSTLYSGESPPGTLTWCARWNIFAVLHIKGPFPCRAVFSLCAVVHAFPSARMPFYLHSFADYENSPHPSSISSDVTSLWRSLAEHLTHRLLHNLSQWKNDLKQTDK